MRPLPSQAIHGCLTCGRTTQCDEVAILTHARHAHGWNAAEYQEKQREAEAEGKTPEMYHRRASAEEEQRRQVRSGFF